MFNFTTVVFDGTSPTFYFTNTSGWNTSSSDLLCFCEGIYLQKVQERNFCFLSSTIRLPRQAYLFHYGSLRRSSLFWDVTQRRLVVSNRRFRTSYPSHLQWPSSLLATLVLLKYPSLSTSPNPLNALRFRILHTAG